MSKVYELVHNFKKKYPSTVAWRIKSHSKVIEKFLNPNEEVIYAFCGQKNDNNFDLFSTYVIALTNKRILLAQKRVLWGYSYYTITPDMYNDMQVFGSMIWGKIYVDTAKELVIVSNISKRGLNEVETVISEYMMKMKKRFVTKKTEDIKE